MSTCPPAFRQMQMPDHTLHLCNVDFSLWMRKISPKEDAKLFKQQFWHVFTVPGWFKTVINDQFHQENSVNGYLWISVHKKCLLLKSDLDDTSLVQWLSNNARLTTQLVEAIVKP